MKTKNWASTFRLMCVMSILILLGLGYAYVKSTIARNETLVTYSKLWDQYYQGVYPLKLEYFTIIGARAITDTLNPPQDGLVYRLSKWVRMRAYERATSTLPSDDLLLQMLRLNTEIDVQYANEQNVGEMYDQLIAMARTSLSKEVLLRNKSIEDKQADEKIQHSIFIGVILDEMSSAKFLSSLKLSEPIKYKNIDKEFCSISRALDTGSVYTPFPLGGICLGSIFNKYIVEYGVVDGCNSADMAALIKQFNITMQQLAVCNSHNLAHNYDSKTILEGSARTMMFVRNGISSICPNRAKEFKSLPNNLM